MYLEPSQISKMEHFCKNSKWQSNYKVRKVKWNLGTSNKRPHNVLRSYSGVLWSDENTPSRGWIENYLERQIVTSPKWSIEMFRGRSGTLDGDDLGTNLCWLVLLIFLFLIWNFALFLVLLGLFSKKLGFWRSQEIQYLSTCQCPERNWEAGRHTGSCMQSKLGNALPLFINVAVREWVGSLFTSGLQK